MRHSGGFEAYDVEEGELPFHGEGGNAARPGA